MRSIVALTLAACLALSACNNDDPDAAPTTTAASSTPATTPANPGVTEPTMRPEAGTNDPSGATNFVDHYLAVMTYASLTGDVRTLTDATSAQCEACHTYIDLYRSTYEKGGYFKGGELAGDNFETEADDDNGILVFVHVTAAPGSYKRDSTSAETEDNAQPKDWVLTLYWTRSQWIVTRLEEAAS